MKTYALLSEECLKFKENALGFILKDKIEALVFCQKYLRLMYLFACHVKLMSL